MKSTMDWYLNWVWWVQLTRNSPLPRLCCEPVFEAPAKSATMEVEKLLLVWWWQRCCGMRWVAYPETFISLSLEVQISCSRWGDCWLIVRCFVNLEILSVFTQSWFGRGCLVIVCNDFIALNLENPSSIAAAHKWSGRSPDLWVSTDWRSDDEPSPDVVGVVG